MTMPYGSGRYGFRGQIKEEIGGHWHDHGVRYLDGGDDFHASVYLAGAMFEAISSVVVAARLAMDWLQETAKIASKEGAPIHWTTPAGFLVLQDYRVDEGVALDFTLLDKRVTMVLKKTGTKLNNRKQSQGISPNFVHSMDASHMMLTVNACVDAGVTSFAMIHDSYGTHAADAETLSYHLRRQFIDQYSGNVLEDFRDEILELVPEEKHNLIPPVPPMGTLDLEDVMKSEYFFA
jgi:DNA-directed RNA polymerase